MKRILITALAAITTITSYATEFAFVNMEKVFGSYHATANADEALKIQQELIKEYLESEKIVVEKKLNDYMTLTEQAKSPALSDAVKKEKLEQMRALRKELEDKKQSVQEYQERKMQEVKEQYESKRAAIIKEISDYIAKWAPRKNIDALLDVSGKTLNGISSVIYYNPEKDVTDELIKSLNAGFEKTESAGE